MAFRETTNRRTTTSSSSSSNLPNQHDQQQLRSPPVGPYFRYGGASSSCWDNNAGARSSSFSDATTNKENDDNLLLPPLESALPPSLAFLRYNNISEDDDDDDAQQRPSLVMTVSEDAEDDVGGSGGRFAKAVKPPAKQNSRPTTVLHRSSSLLDSHRRPFRQQQRHPQQQQKQQRIPYAAALAAAGPSRPPAIFRTSSAVAPSMQSLHRNNSNISIRNKGLSIKSTTRSTTTTSSFYNNNNGPNNARTASNGQLAAAFRNNSKNNNKNRKKNKKVSQKDLRAQYERLAPGGGGGSQNNPSSLQPRQTSDHYEVRLSPLGQVRHPPKIKRSTNLIHASSFDDQDSNKLQQQPATVTLEGTPAIIMRLQYPEYENDLVEDTLVPKRLEFAHQLPPELSFLDAMRTGLKLDDSPDRKSKTSDTYGGDDILILRRGGDGTAEAPAVVSPPRSGPIVLVDYQTIRDAATSQDDDAAEHSEFLLRQMIENRAQGWSSLAPDGGAFNSVLHAYARKGDAIKAEAILDLMWLDFNHGNSAAEPNKRVYTTVMYAWEKSKKKAEAPEACEHLLAQMHELYESGEAPNCKPDLFTYTCILHCWADSKRKDAAARAEDLFRQMKLRFVQGDEDLRPDTICYSNLINCLLSCGRQTARAENTFWEMVEASISGHNHNAHPTIRNFNSILAAWSKSGDKEAPARVERILQRWQSLNTTGALKADVKPDTFSYSLLLKTWAKSKRLDAVDKLMEAFNWLKGLYKAGDSSARLDTIKYATIIGALVHCKKARQAQDILLEMVDDHYTHGNYKAKPDAKCFYSVLSCWSRVHNKTAAQQAESLLRLQWSLFEKQSTRQRGNSSDKQSLAPTTWSYNTVIFCYKSARDPKRAEALLNEMDDMVKAKWMKKGADMTSFRTVHDCWKQSDSVVKYQRMSDLKTEAVKRFGKQI